MTKTLIFHPLNLPHLVETAQTLSPIGLLATSATHWTYLNIDDAYIHQLHPLLETCPEKIDKPEYFGEDLAGAHITVIYPEEQKFVANEDLGIIHQFTVKDAFYADLDLKRYYVLTVESPSLIALRNKYGLGELLSFKDYPVHLHITIGTAPIKKKDNENHDQHLR